MQFYRLITDKIEDAEKSCIALIGGGGKTTLLHKLASEFSKIFPNVLQTSLTKTAFYKTDEPIILQDTSIEKINSIKGKRNPLFVIGEKLSDDKLKGISETDLDSIRKYFNVTIFECDGARNKPLKAHTDYDPIVPKFTANVIIIVGAEVINTKISDGLVHRPELFCNNWKISPDTSLDIDFIVKVVSSKKGYLTKISHDVKITYFVNKADENRNSAMDLAEAIFEYTGRPTFYGSVQKNLLEQVVSL